MSGFTQGHVESTRAVETMVIAKGLSLATPPAAIEACSRSLISRDVRNAHLLHVRVVVFHGGDGCDETSHPPPDITPLDHNSFQNEILPPLHSNEVPIAYAHFVLLRCDLSTTGEELQQALRNVSDTITCHGDRAKRAITYLIEKISPSVLEDTMEAADDRWIDQIATLESFAYAPGLQPADLYAACLKDLLSFTNPTSGLIICGHYPSLPVGSSPASIDIKKAQVDFHDQETDLRSIVVAEFDDASPDHLWVVAGLAQADRRVPGQSWVRLLDSMRYIPS